MTLSLLCQEYMKTHPEGLRRRRWPLDANRELGLMTAVQRRLVKTDDRPKTRTKETR